MIKIIHPSKDQLLARYSYGQWMLELSLQSRQNNSFVQNIVLLEYYHVDNSVNIIEIAYQDNDTSFTGYTLFSI